MYLTDYLNEMINTCHPDSIEYTFASFVKKNLFIIESLTIDDVAKQCHTSNASISRLIKTIGFSNYKSFRLECMEIKQTYMDSLSVSIYPLQTKEMIISYLKDDLPEMIKKIKDKDPIKMANWLLNQNVYLMGNLWEIERIQSLLSNIFVPTKVITYCSQLKELNKNDVIIIVSISGTILKSEDLTYEYLSSIKAKKYLLTTSIYENIAPIFNDFISLEVNTTNSYIIHQLLAAFIEMTYSQVVQYQLK